MVGLSVSPAMAQERVLTGQMAIQAGDRCAFDGVPELGPSNWRDVGPALWVGELATRQVWLRFELPPIAVDHAVLHPFLTAHRVETWLPYRGGGWRHLEHGLGGADTLQTNRHAAVTLPLSAARIDTARPMYVCLPVMAFTALSTYLLPADGVHALDRLGFSTGLFAVVVLLFMAAYFAIRCLRSPHPINALPVLVLLCQAVLLGACLLSLRSAGLDNPGLGLIRLTGFVFAFNHLLTQEFLAQLSVLRARHPRVLLFIRALSGLSILVAAIRLSLPDAAMGLTLWMILLLQLLGLVVLALFNVSQRHMRSVQRSLWIGLPTQLALIGLVVAQILSPAPVMAVVILLPLLVVLECLLLGIFSSTLVEAWESDASPLVRSKPRWPVALGIPLALRYTIALSVIGGAVTAALATEIAEWVGSRELAVLDRNVQAASKSLLAELPTRPPLAAIESWLSLPTIEYAGLRAAHGSGALLHSAGSVPPGPRLAWRFDWPDAEREAELLVLGNLRQTEHTIGDALPVVLGSTAIAMVIAVGLAMVLFRAMVSRHLGQITRYLENLDLRLPDDDLRIRAHSVVRGDELDVLTGAINHLQSELHRSYGALFEANRELEAKVAARAAELERMMRRENRQAQLAQIGVMVASVAHEMRNPLGAMAATVALLHRSSPEHPSVVRACGRLERDIERCNTIIEELRLVGRSAQHSPEAIALSEWLQTLVSDYAEHHRISIGCQVEPGLVVEMDPVRMERVIVVLLDNARQACAARHPEQVSRWEMSLSASRDERGRVRIDIADSGVGFSREDAARLFEPLYSSKVYGFGMGLPLAWSVVERHGGTLSLQGELGKGALARIELPGESEDGPPAGGEAAVRACPQPM